MTNALIPFRALGTTLEDAWRREHNFDARAFPSLALKHLSDARLHESVSPGAILDWALTQASHELPSPQHDIEASFGQPPLTMFAGRHFNIGALFWVDGMTGIHEHGFCGAFQVLAGSSIHTEYVFDEHRRINARLRLGSLTTLGSTLLSKGDAHAIVSGSTFVHSLFHLDRPSVSIVVRTVTDVESQPQLTFLPPGVAYDPFVEEHWYRRIGQLTALMIATEDPQCEARITKLLEREDLFTCFTVLRAARRVLDPRIMARWMEVVAKRDADAAKHFEAAFAEAKRMDAIAKRRSAVVDSELRFFLAVLLNAPDRVAVLELFREYRGHAEANPIDEVIAALDRIGQVNLPLQVRGEAWDANIFGLPPPPSGWQDALRAELAEAPPASVDSNVASYIDRLKHTPSLAVLFRTRAT